MVARRTNVNDDNTLFIARAALITGVAFVVFGVATAGPYCYQCEKVSSVEFCNTVGRCLDHQICYSQEFVDTHTSHTFYRLGCMDANVCTLQSFTVGTVVVGKRAADASEDTPIYTAVEYGDARIEHGPAARQVAETTTCRQCCHGNYCNNNGCGANGASPGKNQTCNDVDPHCDTYGRVNICAPNVRNWAQQYCAKYCGLCTVTVPTRMTTPKTTPKTTPTITVLPPEVTLTPGPVVSIQYKGPFSAHCKTQPGTVITWAFQGILHVSNLPLGVHALSNGSLVFDNINENNTGVYRCVAVGPTGLVTSKTIDVKILPTPPSVMYIERIPNGHIADGDTFSMRCHAIGYPLPYITWSFTDRHGGITIPSSVRYVENEHMLTFSYFDHQHNDGDWSCTATNKFGSSTYHQPIP